MAHGCSNEPRKAAHDLCHAGSKCVACGLQPFDGSYGGAACEAGHGRVLEHHSGAAPDRVVDPGRHVYSLAQPRW